MTLFIRWRCERHSRLIPGVTTKACPTRQVEEEQRRRVGYAATTRDIFVLWDRMVYSASQRLSIVDAPQRVRLPSRSLRCLQTISVASAETMSTRPSRAGQ